MRMKEMNGKIKSHLIKIIGGLFISAFILCTTGRTVYAVDPVCELYNGATLVASYNTINSAILAAYDGYTIRLIADFDAPNTDTIPINLNNLTNGSSITIDLNGHTISETQESYSTNYMVVIPSGKTLMLYDNGTPGTVGTIEGGRKVKSIVKNEGTFQLHSGKITHAQWNQGDDKPLEGGGVYNSGTFDMFGGSIENCCAVKVGSSTPKGGGVYNSGTFNMNGGSITGCSADGSYSGRGGGVYNSGTFNMNGGSISGCSSGGHGGGICNESEGTFTMSGGAISACTAVNGGGIFSFPSFSMNGGSVTGCSASACGGGVQISGSKELSIQGGTTITGNSSPDPAENNLYVQDDSLVLITGNLTGKIELNSKDGDGNDTKIQTKDGRNFQGIGNITFVENNGDKKKAHLGPGGKVEPDNGAGSADNSRKKDVSNSGKKEKFDEEYLANLIEMMRKYGFGDDGKDTEDSEAEIKTRNAAKPDLDTYKSEEKAGTVIGLNSVDGKSFIDFKVHPVDAVTTNNQLLLSNYYAVNQLKAKGAKVIWTKGIYAGRVLSETEKGEKRKLVINNLSVKTPGPIYAVCYNSADKAYLIAGTVDAKGCATFANFAVNEATNISVFTVY